MFDYIHARAMVTCFGSHLQVMRNAYANMNPGAWLEWQDVCMVIISDDGSHEGTAVDMAFRLFVQGGALNGRDFLAPAKYKQYMVEAGFVDVRETRLVCPLSVWPTDSKYRLISRYMAEDIPIALRSMGKLLRQAGMTQDAVDKLYWLGKKELQDPKLRVNFPA
jgi:hypothetical protein